MGGTDAKVILIATRNKGKAGEFAAMFGELGYETCTLLDYPELPDIVEDQDSFLGNALKKAREIAGRLSIPVLADDSGLEVAALAGAPGVYSARYAGEPANDAANNDKLLRELARRVVPRFLTAGEAAGSGGEAADSGGEAAGSEGEADGSGGEATAEEPKAAAAELVNRAAPAGAVQVYSPARFVSVLVLYQPADGTWIRAEGTCAGYILSERRGSGGFGYDPLFYLPEFGKTLAEMTLAEKNRVSHRANALAKLIDQLKKD